MVRRERFMWSEGDVVFTRPAEPSPVVTPSPDRPPATLLAPSPTSPGTAPPHCSSVIGTSGSCQPCSGCRPFSQIKQCHTRGQHHQAGAPDPRSAHRTPGKAGSARRESTSSA